MQGAKEIEKRKEKKEVQYHLAMFQTHLEMHGCKSGHLSLRDFQSRACSSKSKLAKVLKTMLNEEGLKKPGVTPWQEE